MLSKHRRDGWIPKNCEDLSTELLAGLKRGRVADVNTY